jgi:hypothetical protein
MMMVPLTTKESARRNAGTLEMASQKPGSERLFRFHDQRPITAMQRQIQRMAQNNPHSQTQATLQSKFHHTPAQPVVQRVHTLAKRLKDSRDPKRKFAHKRSPTAFGALNTMGKRSLQGPHRISHITTSVVLDTMKRHGKTPLDLLGTRVIPRPRVNNKLTSIHMGGVHLSPKRRAQLARYKAKYRKLYEKAEGGDKSAAEKCIELSALQTYKLGTGKATPAEMKGKGERRGVAADDLEMAGKWTKKKFSVKGIKTLDTTDLKGKELRRQALRFRQLAMAADGQALSDGESEGSEPE